MSVKPAAGQIALSEFPPAVQETVKCFDLSGDGHVNAVELARAAQLYREAADTAKRWRRAALTLGLLLLVVLGVLLGLTYVIVDSSKETELVGDRLTARSDGNPVKVQSQPGILRPSSYNVERGSGGRRRMLSDDHSTKIGEIDAAVIHQGCQILCGGNRDIAIQLPSSVGNLNKDEGDTFFNMRILDSRNCLCESDGSVAAASASTYDAGAKSFSKATQASLVNLNSGVGYTLDCAANQQNCAFLAMSKAECTTRKLTHITDCSDCEAWLTAHNYS